MVPSRGHMLQVAIGAIAAHGEFEGLCVAKLWQPRRGLALATNLRRC